MKKEKEIKDKLISLEERLKSVKGDYVAETIVRGKINTLKWILK